MRYGIGTGRIADHYNARIAAVSNIQRSTNIVLLVDNGKQCTISGFGKLFDKFLKTGNLKDYTGFGTVPATFHEEHFQEAPLRIMTFADTFGNMHYDCRESELYFQQYKLLLYQPHPDKKSFYCFKHVLPDIAYMAELDKPAVNETENGEKVKFI